MRCAARDEEVATLVKRISTLLTVRIGIRCTGHHIGGRTVANCRNYINAVTNLISAVLDENALSGLSNRAINRQSAVGRRRQSGTNTRCTVVVGISSPRATRCSKDNRRMDVKSRRRHVIDVRLCGCIRISVGITNVRNYG